MIGMSSVQFELHEPRTNHASQSGERRSVERIVNRTAWDVWQGACRRQRGEGGKGVWIDSGGSFLYGYLTYAPRDPVSIAARV